MVKSSYFCKKLEFNKSVRSFIAQRHYTKTCPNNVKHAFGLIRASDEELVGVAIFGGFVSRGSYQKYPNSIEFQRLWVCDSVPKNGETFLIGFSLRFMEKLKSRQFHSIISYADPNAGHTGTVYKAANFKLIDDGSDRRATFKYVDANGQAFTKYSIFRQARSEGLEVSDYLNRGMLTMQAEEPKLVFEYKFRSIFVSPKAVRQLLFVGSENPGVNDWDSGQHGVFILDEKPFYSDLDKKDFILGSKLFWDKRGYVGRYIARNRSVGLHREIAQTPKGLVCDHINRLRSDNRLCNLRSVSHFINNHNKKRGIDKGVSFISNRWEASLTFKRRRYYLGRFDTKEEALVAYDKKAVEIYGPYAVTNFPLSDYKMPEKFKAQNVATKPIDLSKNMNPEVVCKECGRRAKVGYELCYYHLGKVALKKQTIEKGRRERVAVSKSTCSREGCDRKTFSSNFCSIHYEEMRSREGYVKPLKKKWICSIKGCSTSAWKAGLCKKHWNISQGLPPKGKITGRPRVSGSRCAFDGCRLEAKSQYFGFCKHHYWDKYKELHTGLDVANYVKGIRLKMNMKETPFARMLGLKLEGLRRIESGVGFLLEKYHDVFRQKTGYDHLPDYKMNVWKGLRNEAVS